MIGTVPAGDGGPRTRTDQRAAGRASDRSADPRGPIAWPSVWARDAATILPAAVAALAVPHVLASPLRPHRDVPREWEDEAEQADTQGRPGR